MSISRLIHKKIEFSYDSKRLCMYKVLYSLKLGLLLLQRHFNYNPIQYKHAKLTKQIKTGSTV